MNAGASLVVPPTLMADLADHLRATGSKLSPAQAAAEAIAAWLVADKVRAAGRMRFRLSAI